MLALKPALDKAVDAEFGAEIGGPLEAFGVERDAGRVGDPVDCVEERDDGGGIDQRRVTETLAKGYACSRRPFIVVTENRLGEIDENCAMRYAAARGGSAEHRREIVGFALMPAARTEQLRMAGGSIETAVQRRYPRRQQFDLRMRDGAIFAAEIAHLERSQIVMFA